MAYRRLISYFDFIEDEQKRGNAGFVKWEKYDECHILSVFVSGLDKSFDKEAKVYLDNSMLGTLSIKDGRAEGTYLLTGEDKEEKEYIERIKIALGDRRELIAEFETEKKLQPKEPVTQEEPLIRQEEPLDEEEEIPETPAEKETEIAEEEHEKVSEEREETVSVPIGGRQEDVAANIWEQLRKTHEPSYPFENEVECFRIFPKDMNLLQPEYRPLQSNQFLMHGYYNYRHLLIFKKKDEAEEYWLGVPGIYHEREKMAARMFGFEKFEASNKEYRTGDLGYYLVTVK